MSTNFPTTLDTYTALVDTVDDVLAAHINNPRDAIAAVEAKVGIDSSAVTTSHDYRITQLRAGTGMTGSSQATSFIPTSSTIPTNGLYLKAANNPALASNSTLRWDVSSAGNHTFAAPSSGIAQTVNGFAGSAIASFRQAAGVSSFISICGNNTTSNSSSFDLQQDLNSDVDIVNRSNGRMSFYTNILERIRVAAAGNITINAPSSGTALTVTPVSGAFAITASASLGGAEVALILQNLSNTASSNAKHISQVAGSSAGDPFTVYEVNGVTDWAIGLDNSDSDTFKIDSSALLSNTTNRFNVTTDGRIYGNALHNNAGAVTGTTNQYVASGTYTPTLTAVTNVSASTAFVCQWLRVGNVVSVSGSCNIDPTSASIATQLGISLPIASNFSAATQAAGTAKRNKADTVSALIVSDAAADNASLYFLCDTDATNLGWYFHFQYEVL